MNKLMVLLGMLASVAAIAGEDCNDPLTKENIDHIKGMSIEIKKNFSLVSRVQYTDERYFAGGELFNDYNSAQSKMKSDDLPFCLLTYRKNQKTTTKNILFNAGKKMKISDVDVSKESFAYQFTVTSETNKTYILQCSILNAKTNRYMKPTDIQAALGEYIKFPCFKATDEEARLNSNKNVDGEASIKSVKPSDDKKKSKEAVKAGATKI